MVNSNFVAHFTGNANDPRHGVIVLCNQPTWGIFVETIIEGINGARTTFYRGQGATGVPVATLDWAGRNLLGTATIDGRQSHMSEFYILEHNPNDRQFVSGNTQQRYMWRRTGTESYDLYTFPGQQLLGYYRPDNERSTTLHNLNMPLPFASLNFTFAHLPLFIDAVVALTINRWVDKMGL